MFLKKRFLLLISILLVLTVFSFCFGGCALNIKHNSLDKEKENFAFDGCVSEMVPHLAVKSNKATFPIDDVTLSFYCGSQNAYENSPYNSTDFDSVTYIYFASENAYKVRGNENDLLINYADDYDPRYLYDKIENDENFCVCIKIYSTEPDAFYKNNTGRFLFTDIPKDSNNYAVEDAWGAGSAFYKASYAYSYRGVFIPDISYTFTIPQNFFTKTKGFLCFCVASYILEYHDGRVENGSLPEDSFIAYVEGTYMENRELIIYYTRNGSEVTLSREYN